MNLLFSPLIWVVLGVFYLFTNKKPKGTNLSIFEENKTESDGSESAQTSGGSIVNGATINISKAKSKAIELVELFDAFFSSEADIVAVFKNLNKADFILIYDQFGTSHVRSLFGNESLSSSGTDDLIYWLKKEVTTPKYKNLLSKQFPTIL